jgi:hypothetical protein
MEIGWCSHRHSYVRRGSDPPPPVEEFVDALAEALERPVHLTVKVTPETAIEIDSER